MLWGFGFRASGLRVYRVWGFGPRNVGFGLQVFDPAALKEPVTEPLNYPLKEPLKKLMYVLDPLTQNTQMQPEYARRTTVC